MKWLYERFGPLLALTVFLLFMLVAQPVIMEATGWILLLVGTSLALVVLLGWALMLLQALLWLGRENYSVIRQHGMDGLWTVTREDRPFIRRDTLADCIAEIRRQRLKDRFIAEAIADGKVSSAA